MRTIGVALLLTACAGADVTTDGAATNESQGSSTVPPSTSTSTTTTVALVVPTTSSTTTTAAPTTTATTATPTTAAPSTVPPAPPVAGQPIDLAAIPVDQPYTFGTSVQGRPLTVIRRGDPAGVRVLVIGAIHGNEDDGMAIVDVLATAAVPSGVELWLVPAVNPDGVAAQDRQNANGVDLNRNFPEKWAPLGELGEWQYGGVAAASEPETRAMVALGNAVQADLTLWYHQDLFRISPSTGRQGQFRQRYAELTGLPLVAVTGGTYTGTASQWSRVAGAQDNVGFTVELGPTLSAAEAATHAAAVLSLAVEL
jgi:protein MpaA